MQKSRTIFYGLIFLGICITQEIIPGCFQKVLHKKTAAQTPEQKSGCIIPELIGEQPDMLCILAKQLARLRHYGDHQDEIPSFFIFYGKEGCGKRTAAKWIIKEGGAHEIWIHANEFIKRPLYVDELYEEADKLAKKINRPVVIVIEDAERFSYMPGEPKDFKFGAFMRCTHMWNYYHTNPYITTIYLYNEFKRGMYGDILSRCLGIFWEMPNKQTRKEIIQKNLPKNHTLSEHDIERMARWTYNFSGGELIKLIQQTQGLKESSAEFNKQQLCQELKKVLWKKHISSHKKEIGMYSGIASLVVMFFITRKYHPAWTAYIKNLFHHSDDHPDGH